MTTRRTAAIAASLVLAMGTLVSGCKEVSPGGPGGPEADSAGVSPPSGSGATGVVAAPESSSSSSGAATLPPANTQGVGGVTRDVTEFKATTSRLDRDMAQVIESYDALKPKPLDECTVEEARRQPTLADAVKATLEKQHKSTAPIEVGRIEARTIPGRAGDIPLRIYHPKKAARTSPVIVYFHGGGFVIGTIDAYDASIRGLVDGTDAIVVAVEYRKAPEHKFPAAHDDAFVAYDWVLGNAASFGGDAKRVAVAGESAGGNLALNVAITARDLNKPIPVHELLVYPLAGTATDTASYRENENARPLGAAAMKWLFGQFERNADDAKDLRLDLLHANVMGLPATTIVLAEIDPLRTEGEQLYDRMNAAGVLVEKKTYEGVPHEFFGTGAVVSDAKSAMGWASSRLRKSFGN